MNGRPITKCSRNGAYLDPAQSPVVGDLQFEKGAAIKRNQVIATARIQKFTYATLNHVKVRK